MSTLCTAATNSLSTCTKHRSIGAVDPANTRQTDRDTGTILMRLGKSMKRYLVMRYNQRIDRQAFNNVLSLDDRTLRDIGVTRQDVKWASRLPLAEDAAQKLEQIARRK